MIQTNYGAMDLVIDDRTGHARRVRGVKKGSGVPVMKSKQVSQGKHGRRTDRATEGHLARNTAMLHFRSNLEAAWANYLDVLKAVKEIDGWAYESVNFRLPGQKNFWKVDFSAWTDSAVTFYEVKGKNKSDDRSLVKMKTAAGLNPWARFVLVKRVKGAWEEREIR